MIESEYLPEEFEIEKTDFKKEVKIKRKTASEIADFASKQSRKNQGKTRSRKVQTTVYERDPSIRQHVKNLARGVCQLCELPAPFEVDGEPFLHVHHIEFLADGGDDTIENCIALCPNCHSKVHQINQEHYKKVLKKKVSERE